MAKRYDPIMCMMVDEPTKAHDELSLAQKKQVVTELKGYLKKSYNFSDESEYARAYEDLRHMFNTGSRKSISGLFENTVKKTGAHDAKARDVAPATQRYINTIVDESKANAEKFVRQAEQDDEVPENELKYVYKAYNEKFGYKFHDSASALDKAIKTADGMFSKAFGEYSKGAKFKKDKFLKELASIEDAKEFASKMQTFDNELRKNLERLDEAYNVAGQDYYSARNEIRSIMDAFSKEAFGLYRKLDTK